MRRRLLSILAAVALVFGLGTAVATYHALPAAAATGATGAITGYEGLCLDDRSASTADFNPIQVYTCNGTSAQQWTVASGNTLQVLGMCLDVNAAGTANGTLVDLYTCNGTAAHPMAAIARTARTGSSKTSHPSASYSRTRASGAITESA